jgi:hypothetical protein
VGNKMKTQKKEEKKLIELFYAEFILLASLILVVVEAFGVYVLNAFLHIHQ